MESSDDFDVSERAKIDVNEDNLIKLALKVNQENEVEPDYMEEGFKKLIDWLHVLLKMF